MSRARRFADKGNLHSLVLNATDGSATDAGDKVLLDGTDTSASNAGFTILLEDATGNADVRITSQLHNGVFNFTSVPKNDNNPAFYVTTLTDDTNAELAHSKILFDVVHFDTINGWDSTNYQYKPTVSGYYHFYAQWSEISVGDVFDLIIGFSKGSDTIDAAVNVGAGFRRLRMAYTNFDWYASTLAAETVMFMNGDDEYVRVYAYGNSENGSTVTLQGNGRTTFFGGHLVSKHDSTGNWNYSNSVKNYEY